MQKITTTPQKNIIFFLLDKSFFSFPERFSFFRKKEKGCFLFFAKMKRF